MFNPQRIGVSRVLILFIATFAALPAAGQDQLWLRQFGSSSQEYLDAVAADGAGGVFVSGRTRGGLAAPNVGDTQDAWVARYDSAGGQQWIRQFGSFGADQAWVLAPDGAGGVFVGGTTSGNLGGASMGAWDVWLARYNSSGTRIWIRQFGSHQYDYADAIIPDGAGGVYIGGRSDGNMEAPGSGSPQHAWLARYNSAGQRLWMRQFSPFGVGALAPDGAGGVFVACGVSIGFSVDVWLARYDGAGEQVWVRQPPTSAYDVALGLTPDGEGGVFMTGFATGDFGGPSAGGEDAWLARHDSAGEQVWIRQFGTGVNDRANCVTHDGAGGVLVGGYTIGSLGGPHQGSTDAWLARFDVAGNQTMIGQLGTSGLDEGHGLAPDGLGGVYFAGWTSGSLGGASAGGLDAWVSRYSAPACPVDWNEDTLVNSTDISAFLTTWLASVQGGTLEGDFSGDGVVNSTDISAFLSAWLGAVVTGC